MRLEQMLFTVFFLLLLGQTVTVTIQPRALRLR
jgi:hypothetical protein